MLHARALKRRPGRDRPEAIDPATGCCGEPGEARRHAAPARIRRNSPEIWALRLTRANPGVGFPQVHSRAKSGGSGTGLPQDIGGQSPVTPKNRVRARSTASSGLRRTSEMETSDGVDGSLRARRPMSSRTHLRSSGCACGTTAEETPRQTKTAALRQSTGARDPA